MSRIFSRTAAGILSFLLLGWQVAGAWAADPSPSPDPSPSAEVTVGPQTAVGPTAPVGPQDPVGPQTAVGPTAPVGPQDPVGPQPSSAPAASSAAQTAAPASSSTGGSQPAAVSNGSSQTISTTGPGSSASNQSSSSSTATVSDTKNASINNSVQADANSGHNTVTDNTAVGQVSTGNVNGVVNLINVANSTFAPDSSVGSATQDTKGAQTVSLSDPSSRSSLAPSSQSISGTGPNSSSQNVLQDSNVVKIVRLDQASVNNQGVIRADTGDNAIAGNTKVQGVKTGDINLAVNQVNLLNVQAPETQVDLNIWSLKNVNPQATIVVPQNQDVAGTGPNSSATNNSSTSDATSIQVVRNADAQNSIRVVADTGNNAVTDNSKVGSLQTGSTHVDGAEVNIANQGDPVFYLVNVFGDWNGTLQGVPAGSYAINRLDGTGPNSSAQNLSTVSSDRSYSLTQNASVNNGLLVDATTGHNTIADNTAVGDVSTGSINVYANIINFLNSVARGAHHVRIGIINIFASPLGAPKQSPLAGVPDPVVSTVVNSGTAPATVTLTAPSQGAPSLNVTSPVSSLRSVSQSNESTAAVHAMALVPYLPGIYASQPVSQSFVPTLIASQQKIGGQQAVSQRATGSPATPIETVHTSVALTVAGIGLLVWLGNELLALAMRRRRSSL